jgi:hypothetical protein
VTPHRSWAHAGNPWASSESPSHRSSWASTACWRTCSCSARYCHHGSSNAASRAASRTWAFTSSPRYAIQHTLGFQIWELDQPHLLQAHGRSLTGYHLTGTEQHHLAKIRERFTQATRFDEDD